MSVSALAVAFFVICAGASEQLCADHGMALDGSCRASAGELAGFMQVPAKMKVATSMSTIAEASPDPKDSEDDDPDVNTDCTDFNTAAECGTKGCSWTDAFDGEHDERLEEKEDGSDEVTGYVCVDDEEVREELRDRTNVSVLNAMQLQEDQLDVANSVRGCRRRWRRRSCPYARRRRAPRNIPQYAGDLKGKVATQSSTAHGGSAARAIDGNGDNFWSAGSCTHTRQEDNPWWQVDLGSPQDISGIRITNRGDCCGGRLNGFTLLIDGKSCAQTVEMKQGETKIVPCAGSGQVLRVQVARPRVTLTVCEFEVIKAIAPTLAPAPIASPAPTQTSTAGPGQAATPSPSQSASPSATPSPALAVSSIFNHMDQDSNNMIDRREWRRALDREKEALDAGKTTPAAPTTITPFANPTSTAASSTLPTKAQQDAVVKKHNDLRAEMGASDMTKMVWDDTLAAAAQLFASGCPSGHSDNRPSGVGENMAWKWASGMKVNAGTDFTPSVQSWYDEFGDAGPYKKGGMFSGFGPCPGVCGHYTQVVWAAANKVGCGAAYCPHSSGMGGYELVCQYGTDVPGSYGGNMRGSVIFEGGAACSKCPSGFAKCSDKLCAVGA